MPADLPSLRSEPIGFAHRGARAQAPDNTIESFELALKLGAKALESDVWVTADGVAVLDHDGQVGGRLRRRPIAKVDHADLPDHIPSLGQLYEQLGTDFDLSLDVKDPAAGTPAIDATMAADPTMATRLWLCDSDHDRLVALREVSPHVRLVDSTRHSRVKEGHERRAAKLSDLGVDALNMHHSDWNGGLVTLFHRFGVLAFSWDLQFPRTLNSALAIGVDAVYSDHVERMMSALARRRGLAG